MIRTLVVGALKATTKGVIKEIVHKDPRPIFALGDKIVFGACAGARVELIIQSAEAIVGGIDE